MKTKDTNITEILDEVNQENGSNYKIAVLKKYQDNEVLKRVLKMAYDRVDYIYGLTTKNVKDPVHKNVISIDQALEVLEMLNRRDVTGNTAIELVENTLSDLSPENAELFKKILDRDLRINMGKTNINKVFKNLIKKQPYMRCGIADSKALAKIDWESGVMSQLKCDGTYRSFNDGVFTSRSGKVQSFPKLEKMLEEVSSKYVLIGEMTLKGEKQRSKGNGLINSSDVPEDDIIYTIWDAIPIEEYQSKNGKIPYYERIQNARAIVYQVDNPQIEIIPSKTVYSRKEAYEHFQEVTKEGLEGTVIKTQLNLWKDGTGKDQLKLKLEIDVEVRITGFTEGNNKRAKTFGAITFENDEGTIKGQTSGFTDKQLDIIHKNRDKYLGEVMTVRCNDITKAKGSDTWALSHPRFIPDSSQTHPKFITIRDDKDTTDTLERVQLMKKMAMEAP